MIQSDKETFLQLTERIDRIALSAFGSNSENSNKYLSIVRPQLISICQNSNTHLQKLTAASDADILLLLQNKINSSPSLPIQKNSKPSNKKKTLISCGVLGLFIVLLLVAAGVLFMFGDIFPSTKKKTIAQTETQANVHQPDTQSPSIHKQSFTYQSLIDAVQQVKQKEADRMNEIDKMMGVCPFISGEVTDRFYKDENGNDIDILLVYGSVHWQDKPKGGPFGKAGNILVVNPEQGGVFSDSNKYFESLSHDYFGRSDDQAVNAFGVEVSSFIYKPNEQITDIGQGIRDLQVEIDSAKRRIPEIYNGYIHSLFADCTYPNETSECKQQLEKLISSVTEKGFFNSFNFASPDIPTMIMGKKKIGTRAQGRSISNYIQYFDKENNCLVSLDEKQQFFNAYKIIAPKELSQYTSDELIKSSLAEFSELHPDYCNAPLLHPTAEAVAKEMGYKLIKQHANLDKMPTLSIVSIKKDTDRITNTNTIPWQECHAIDKYKNFLYHNNAKLLYETPNGLVNKQPQQRPWRCLSNQEKFDLTNRLQRELPSHFMRNIDNWIMEVKSVSSSREIVLSLPPKTPMKEELLILAVDNTGVKRNENDDSEIIMSDFSKVKAGDWICCSGTTQSSPSNSSPIVLSVNKITIISVPQVPNFNYDESPFKIEGYHFLCQSDGNATRVLAYWPLVERVEVPDNSKFSLPLENVYTDIMKQVNTELRDEIFEL